MIIFCCSFSNANGASFDCKKSRTFVEQAICADKQLSRMDVELAVVFKKALKIAPAQDELREEQQEWLTTVRDVCPDRECLTQAYEERIESLRNYNPSPNPVSTQKSVCQFSDLALPKNFAVFAAGNYSGQPINFQIDQSGHQATQMNVTVNVPLKPVVLMLGAYEPTIWNIRWTSATRILAVLVSGYHRQAVAGLHASVPILNSSSDNKGPCSYFYVSEKELEKLNPIARQLFGRPVDLVYFAKRGDIMIGEPVSSNVKLVTSSANPPESFYDKTAPLAGQAGLLDALQKGLLRKATEADADAWVRALMAKAPKRDEPSISGQGPRKPPRPTVNATACTFSTVKSNSCKQENHSYVVLKQFTYPAGLYGAHSVTFFILKGVPKPKGNPGHSTVYDFGSIKCDGPSCN